MMTHIVLGIFLWSQTLKVVDAARDSVSPMEKIRELLANLKEKVRKEGEEESVTYQKFTRWCDLEAQECQSTIVQAKKDMEQSKAEADQARALQQTLQFELQKIQYQITGKEKELKGAIARREKEHKAFQVADKQFYNTISTLSKALDILSRPLSKAAMLELSAALAQTTKQQPAAAVSNDRLQSFFQSVASDGQAEDASQTQAVIAPSAPVYASKSGELKEVLKQMQDDVKADRKKINDEEQAQAHSFEKFQVACEAEINAMKGKLQDRKKALAAAQAEEARAMKALQDATALHDETVTHLGEVKAMCEEKAREFEAREKSRAEELTVLGEALKILSDDKMQAAEKRRGGAASFIQVSMSQHDVKRHSIESIVESAMEGDTSKALNFLQTKSRDEADPFAKVKKMMEGMITKLLNEAAEEKEHKAWCDGEIAKTEKQQKFHLRNQEKFSSRVEQLIAEIDMLAKKVAELSAMISEMTASAEQVTNQRSEENVEAMKAIEEYRNAQAAVQKAIQVISDFYEKQKRSEALLQAKAAPPPDTGFSGTTPGGKRQDAAQSIIAIMEVALSDFARLQSEYETEEASAQREYVNYMQSYKVQKAVAEQEIKNSNAATTKAKGDLAQSQEDLKNTNEELAAVNEYMGELDKSCNFEGPSLEERQARRQKQIQGLQNALAIISGEALP